MPDENVSRWAVGWHGGRRVAFAIIGSMLALGAVQNLYFLVPENKTYRPNAIIKYQELQSGGAFWFDLVLNLSVLVSSILSWIILRSFWPKRPSH